MDNKQIADMLRAVLAKIEESPVDDAPPGCVVVKPTGPQGAGVVRFWPEVTDTDLNLWSYAIRCSRTINPATKASYYPAGRWGAVMQPSVRTASLPFPEALDNVMHPEQWATQAELDEWAALSARDQAAGAHFSPG